MLNAYSKQIRYSNAHYFEHDQVTKMELKDIYEIIIETEGENPVLIATITEDEMIAAEGYRIRLKPKYD